ncbi:MAG: hypothetical protein GY870_03670 [archaeon]|nr:hypothetical protein [archaeon]
MMNLSEEDQEKKRKAEKFIDMAEDFIAKGKIVAGFKSYQKATNIYFQIGSFLKISEIFIRISTLLRKETTIYEAMEYLRKIKERLQRLDLPEEEAKIMMVMGNLSYKIGDYSSASENFEECAELYLKAEPEEYKTPSAMFLIRAAECYERIPNKSHKGERIIIQATLRLNKKSLDYQAEEYKGLKLLKQKKHEEAIPIYSELYQFFDDALGNLSLTLEKSEGLAQIAIQSKTRLIHIISEYRMILMICHEKIGEKDKAMTYATESIDHLNSAIEMLKALTLKDIWTREELKRLTYIGFMRAYFQKYKHIKNPDQSQQIQLYIAQDMDNKPLEILKELPYFDLCTKTETYELEQINEELSEFNLGRLEKYKFFLQS